MAKHVFHTSQRLAMICVLAVLSVGCAASDVVSGKGATMSPPSYPTKSSIGIFGKKTGFFHVQRFGDKWWTIDPAGNAFFIIGTDHVNYNVHWCEALGYAPYQKNNEKTYGGEEKWADNAVERLKSWGFTALAANNSPSTRYKGLPYMEFAALGQGFSSIDYITERTTWTGFPNVFSAKWQQFCDDEATKQCTPHKDDPWLIGYFLDNELEWYGKTGSLFNDTFKRPSDHTAKIALVDMLKTRYGGDISAFNLVWQTNASSFDDLLKLMEAPKSASPKAQEDVIAYAQLCADRYFAGTTSAIRKIDPNHMILGCRFAGSAPDVWAADGKYCDIVSVNCYRNLDLVRGVMTDGFESDLAGWHTKANRPMMITEWSFPGLDAGLPSVHGAGMRVRTQADRARAFTVFQKLLFSTPFIVGSDYFMWVDEPALGIAKTFPEDSNYGLVDVNDKPYGPITEAATKLHARAYDIHSSNVADVYTKPSGKQGVFVVGNSGKASAKCKVTTWVDGRKSERTVSLVGGESRNLDLLNGESPKPGGHLLICRIESDDPLAEPNSADNEAHDLFYVPEPSSARRIPVLVANLTDQEALNVPMSIKLSDLRMSFSRDATMIGETDISLGGNVHMMVPSQVIPGDSILFQVQIVEPRKCATLYVYPGVHDDAETDTPVKYTPAGSGFEADNGILKLIRGDSGGNAFDRIEYKSTEVGGLLPIVNQQAGQGFWLRPDTVEDIRATNGPVALVLDMTFRWSGDSSAKTSVRPHAFRTKYRFVVYPNQPYLTSRCLWIENADLEPWSLRSYFHYLAPSIGGDPSVGQSRGRYWYDDKTNLCYGVSAPANFRISLWKDPAGKWRGDVHRFPFLDVSLKPGQRFTPDDSPVYVITGDEETFDRVSHIASDSSGLAVKVCKMDAVR